LNDRLLQLLNQNGHSFTSTENRDNCEIKNIKEKLCYVAHDYDAEMKSASDQD
jgi:actin beta/gamma 1